MDIDKFHCAREGGDQVGYAKFELRGPMPMHGVERRVLRCRKLHDRRPSIVTPRIDSGGSPPEGASE
jgi:hypothetical protein